MDQQKKRYIQWKYQGKSPLEKLIERFPNKHWVMYDISHNPNITWEFVEDHPEIRCDYEALSQNPNITWEIL